MRALQEHPNINRLIEVIRVRNNRDIYLILEFVPSDLTNVLQVRDLDFEHIALIIY